MSDFGDGDPEDAWDPDDPIPDLLRNLIRRLALLVVLRELGDRDRQRLRMLSDDLGRVLARLEDE